VAAIWLIPWLNNGRYPESVAIFQILLIATFAEFITLPSSSLLVAQERYTTLAWVNAAVVAATIPLAIVSAHLFGVIGVAAAGTVVGILQVTGVSFLATHPPAPGTHKPMRRSGQLAG
jgi:O-antigen/teichoic acid export membrane protein